MLKKSLNAVISDFSSENANEWLRHQFPAFAPFAQPIVLPMENDADKRLFSSAAITGLVSRLPGKGDVNHPLLVAVIKCNDTLTERSSRSRQFDLAKRLLRSAAASTIPGIPDTNGLVVQGLFFYCDSNGTFRLSFVKGSVTKRSFNFGSARRRSFLVNPASHNNTLRRRFAEPIRTFEALEQAFSVEALTKEFYNLLFEWYQQAVSPESNVTFPNYIDDADDDVDNLEEAMIRLITRIMFVWFIKQKGIIPDALFDKAQVAEFLESFDPYDMGKSNYYNAILQNLFFATLNCTIEKRDFSKKRKSGLTTRRGIKTFWRCYTEFSDPEAFVKLVRNVPFLNCALFECLDKEVEVEETGEMRLRLIDGFSDKKEHRAFVPNGLFFRSNETGLIDIFKRYEFTVDENTSNDADIALDPELLGKVFENLLGAYNPETRETARKATGSFYTPREIVDYMVRESLRSYLKGKVADATDEELDALFDRSPDPATGNAVLNTLRKNRERHGEYLDALYKCRILDPACGSGAFPMGILHAMTELFARLDPDNIAHLARINESYKDDMAGLKQGLSSEDLEEREEQIKERLKEGRAYPDYARKLYLIENCIYGIDIQPIATQISKLRFFISLLCDQLRTNYDAEKENFNLLSLPNLEAKFVCANSLVPLPRLPSGALDLSTGNLNELRLKLQKNRHVIFNARTATTKEKYKRIDEEIRREIKAAVKVTGAETDNEKIAYLSEQLKQLKEERSKVGEPWIEAGAAEKQTVLFDDFMTNDTPPLLHDANEKKRAELDEAIIRCEASIQKEYAKRDNRGSTELDELAELVAGWDPFDQNATSPFFDSEWMFNIKDGFDIVIGNPPYIRLENNKGELANLYKDYGYKTFVRTGDIYCLFYELGINLLSYGGTLTYITSNKWMRAGYGKETRALLSRHNPLQLIDMGPDVFTSAVVDTNILVIEKAETTPKEYALRALDLTHVSKSESIDSFADYWLPVRNVSEKIWIICTETELRIREKIEKHGTPLKEWDVNIYRGVLTGCNEAFVIDGATKDRLIAEDKNSAAIIKPMLKGRDILRYQPSFADWWLINTHNGVKNKIPPIDVQKDYPAIYQYLSQFKTELCKRQDKGLHWSNLRNCAYLEEFEKEKIVFQEMVQFSVFAYDKEDNFLCLDTARIITGENLKYLVAVMNSELFFYGVKTFYGGGGLGQKGVRMKHTFFREFPVPKLSPEQQKPVISIADQILAAKAEDPEADTSQLEAEIDAMVYRLYGLTDEEIAVVEGTFKKADDAEKPARPAKRAKPAPGTPPADDSPDDEDDYFLE